MNFSDLDLEDCILDALDSMNFRECTRFKNIQFPFYWKGKI